MKRISSPERIVDSVYAELRDAILRGEIVPNEQLSVPELSRRLNVSRSPVREAVLQLVSDGLVVERARKGCVVAAVSLADLVEIHDMRGVLEALAVSRIETVSDALIATLETSIARQEKARRDSDWRAFNDADRIFHETLHAAAGNGRLLRTLARLRCQMEIALVEVAQSDVLMSQSIVEHKAVLAQLREHDIPQATIAMRHHIDSTKARIQRGLSQPNQNKKGN